MSTALPGFRLEPDAASSAMRATIAAEHEFYFDHPLTHAPGLLLLDIALAALGRTGGREPPWFSRVEIAFQSLCAIEAPVDAAVTARPSIRRTCSWGGGTTRCCA
jgi:hypothetical protein